MNSLFSQIGILDNSFSPGTGANASILSNPVQADGKIIAGGSFTNYNGTVLGRIVRLNSDGTIDNSFAVGTGFNSSVNKIIIQPDGKILSTGAFTTYQGANRYRLVRLNTDGSVDGTFSAVYGPNNITYNAALQSDGKIVVVGSFTQYNTTGRNRIARATSTGGLDNTFTPGTGANNIIYGLAIQSDGNMVIGGAFTTYNGTSITRIARITSSGAIDPTFTVGTGATGTGTAVVVRTCELQSDGKILIGGNFTAYDGNSKNNIARLNSDGTIDATFNTGTGANAPVTSINIQQDGKIIIMGQFTTYNGVSRNRIARLNSDGTLDLTFTPGTAANNTIFAGSFQPDGKFVIGGQFTTYTGTSRASIARLLMTCPTVTLNSLGQTNETCNGQTIGTATVTASGGVSQTYSWAPSGSTTTSVSNLAAGTYTCYATNECANTTSLVITITEPSIFSLSSPTTNTTSCVGANVNLSVSSSGGTGAASYTWNPGNLSGPSQTVNPASSTVYTINANDASGCSASIQNTVSVVSCPGPVLTAGSCGVTLSALDQVLNFTSVSGATNYRLEITNASQPFSTVNVRGNSQTVFRMSWVTGIQYGRTYNIRISAYIGGAWQPYGNTCTVTTPAAAAIPSTQFNAPYCNSTISTLDQLLYFNAVSGATNYKFEVICAAQSFTTVNVRNNTVLNFRMSWISGIQYNRTYDVRISAYVNNIWQSYGSVCTITTPASIPTTSLVPASCGVTVGSLSQILNFTSVVGATNYKVQVVNAAQPFNVVNVRNNTQTTFALAYASGTTPNRTYDVSVASYVGGVWSSFGPVCQVTSTGAKADDDNAVTEVSRKINVTNEEVEQLVYSIYPNPNNGNFVINTNEDTQIIIYNTVGEVVLDSKYASGQTPIDISEQKSGIYYVKMFGLNKEANFKIIKQ